MRASTYGEYLFVMVVLCQSGLGILLVAEEPVRHPMVAC